MAHNKKLARQTDNVAIKNGCAHCKIEKRRRNNSSRMAERKTQKKDIIMNRYEMDQNIERKQLPHWWAGHMARADTDTGASRALRTRGFQWWCEKTMVCGRCHMSFSVTQLEPTRMRWENDQVCGVTESWSSARDSSVTSGRDVDR